jgi:hypothetical protein
MGLKRGFAEERISEALALCRWRELWDLDRSN